MGWRISHPLADPSNVAGLMLTFTFVEVVSNSYKLRSRQVVGEALPLSASPILGTGNPSLFEWYNVILSMSNVVSATPQQVSSYYVQVTGKSGRNTIIG